LQADRVERLHKVGVVIEDISNITQLQDCVFNGHAASQAHNCGQSALALESAEDQANN
jgi:hypothetical protein